MIPNKSAYVDDETSAKVVKVVAPGIRKLAVIILFYFALFYSLLI